jgi:carbamoyltransferase
MKILGIQKHHNSSACLFEDGNLIYYNQEERLSKIKKDFGFPLNCLNEIKKITSDIDVVVITGYDYIAAENASIAGMLSKLGFKFPDKDFWFSYYKGHHLAHAAKAFYNSNFDDALVIVWDGKGSTFSLSDGTFAHETTTAFYATSPSQFETVYKRLYTPFSNNPSNLTVNDKCEYGIYNKNLDINHYPNELWEVRNDHDIGHLYEFVSNHIGFGEEEAGKMMGLQSYGKFNDDLPSNLLFDQDKYYTNMELFNFDDPNTINTDKFPILKDKQALIDFSFHTQKSLETVGLSVITHMLKLTGAKNLILTGGVTLNVVANNFYRKNIPQDVKMYIEPLCGDEGNCIGAVQLYYNSISQNNKKNVFKNIYLGPTPNYDFILGDNEVIYDDVSKSNIVELLIAQNIVAIFQGGAEAGPRALGNRSLLFDPRIKNGKDIVNAVKMREEFRPFACSVMLDHAKQWFDFGTLDDSPYMMYALDALPGVKEKIPSVIHEDNTSRVQTVTRDQNPHFYDLINEFYIKTETPLLFNTSFNLAGNPLVETIHDAITTLRLSKLEYLYLPEVNKLIHIRNSIQ